VLWHNSKVTWLSFNSCTVCGKFSIGWRQLLTQLILAGAQVDAQWRHQLLPASPAAPHQAPASVAAAGTAVIYNIHCKT
jgi:hypothetical protein